MNDSSLEDDGALPEAELIPESDLDESGEPPAVPEVPGIGDYPWANGDAAVMLRSFIFQTVCDSDQDIPNQMSRMQAAYEWVTTGNYTPEEPSNRGKSHLKPVKP
jgi:hypothetical protein